MNTDVEIALIIFKFSPFLRTEYPSGDKQINNGTESFHAHFNGQFYCSHPKIYTFTNVIKTTNH